MKTIDISKATESLAVYARESSDHPVIVTSKGKPVAALIDVRGMDEESLSLSCNPTFVRIIKKSRESYKRDGGISNNDVRRRLGIKPKRRKT